MTTSYDRNLVVAADSEEPNATDTDKDFGEVQVAEYIVFLLALDTYMRYLEEASGPGAIDDLTETGLLILRRADSIHIDAIGKFLDEHLPSAVHKTMLAKALRLRPNPAGASRRALQIRTLLSRGGAGTMRGVFHTNKALQAIRTAISASMIEDADKALDKFAVIQVRNARLRNWIDDAAGLAGSGNPPGLVTTATKGSTADDAKKLLEQKIRQDGASATSEEGHNAATSQDNILKRVEHDATTAARRAMEVSGEDDLPPRKSTVVGIATAAAVAAISDPDNEQNVPQSLRGLDPEQRAAALTDGQVLVAASAGSGKTHTVTCRIAYLIQERKVPPSRIFAVSFNRKAAQEMRERIGAKVGKDILDQMHVGTMHGMFRKFVVENGTPEEKAALTSWLMTSPSKKAGDQNQRSGRGPTPGAFAGYMGRIWKACFDEAPPRGAGNVVQGWMMNDTTPEQAKLEATSPTEHSQAVWYEWVLGFKGVNKSWQPPCVNKNPKAAKMWGEFLAKWRDNGRARLGDFSDMIIMFRDILKRDPSVRKKVQAMFDHVLVDEAQDLNSVQHQIIEMMTEHVKNSPDKSVWLVGDEVQCIHEDTPVMVDSEGRTVLAKTLKPGDTVQSYRNGEITAQVVRRASTSAWTWGYRVTTTSGKTLTMSPNHRLWVSGINPEVVGDVVYLMYRSDLGFRLGVTCVNRMNLENADAVWFLELCKTREDAQLTEATYSLTYGIPTFVFNGHEQGLNQDRLNALFERFGSNGMHLLDARHLDFTLPHWTPDAGRQRRVIQMLAHQAMHLLGAQLVPHWTYYAGRQRRVIQMLAHQAKGTLVTFEWSGDDLHDKIKDLVAIQPGEGENGYRVRHYCESYRDALALAMTLRERTGAYLNRRISVPNDFPFQLVNASGVLEGMRVIVNDDQESVATEEVVSVEKVNGTFIDLDVDDASNFFGGGILSHNSINRFVGARPELFTQFNNKDGWVTKSIKTNYRCLPEIVEHANKLMGEHPRGIPMEARPDPTKPTGQASIVVQQPGTHASGAHAVVAGIRQDLDAGAPITDYAVLTRTNMEINDYETSCIIQGVPYARKGGTSFLRSPETITVMSYFNLAVSQDFERMQKSLIEVFNKPNRFYLRAGEAERIVNDAVEKRARRMGVSTKNVNPLDLFDREGLSDLVDVMDPQRRWESWKVRATREELENLGRALHGMRRSVEEGKTTSRDGIEKTYTTQDLFGDILNVPGVPERRGDTPPRLRDVLMPQVSTNEEESDAPAEETVEPIGNVEFLFQIAQPDPSNHETDPSDPKKFKARIDKLVMASKDLRIDLNNWENAQSKLDPAERKAPPCVILSTVHSTKGGQWNHTTVVMARGVFPYEPKPNADEESLSPEQKEKLEEKRAAEYNTERQLAYVAMTRAAKSLTIVCPDKSVYGRNAGVSTFVNQAGLAVGQNVSGKNDPTPEPEPLPTVLASFYSEGDWPSPEQDDLAYTYDRSGS